MCTKGSSSSVGTPAKARRTGKPSPSTSVGEGRIEVPVRQLRSGNPLEDAELQRRVDARRFPTIVGEVRQAAAADGGGRFQLEGDLSFHGVTQRVTGELRVSVDGDRIR